MTTITIEQVRKITAKHIIEDYPVDALGMALPESDSSELKGCENHSDDQFLVLLQNGAHLDFDKYRL